MMSDTKTSPSIGTLRDAYEFHRRGRSAQAERICRSILESDPDNFDASHLLGVVLLWRGEFDAAELALSRAAAINPASADVHLNRGAAPRSLLRYQEALASFEKAIALQPDFAEGLYGRGFSLMDLGRFDEALASFDAAIAVKPDYAEAYNDKGITLGAMNRHEEAVASFDRALAIKPSYAHALNNRGIALCTLQRFEEALASYAKSIALNPTAEVFFNRGIALVERKHASSDGTQSRKLLADALASYDQAIGIRPHFPQAYKNRGDVLRELGRIGEARASYEQALALRPDFSEAREALAQCG